MKITNVQNLPQTMVKAMEKMEHKKHGDFSVTELLDSPFKIALQRKHIDDITEDAQDRIWSFFGSLMHYLLEMADEKNSNRLSEETLSINVDDVKIYGTPDLYEPDGTLYDFKFTSTWSYIYRNKPNSRVDEWTKQLNMYRLLIEHTGFPVKKLQIVCIMRDWSESKALSGGDYPSKQVAMIDVPLWDKENAMAFLRERIALHKSVDKQPCTPVEKWAKPSVFACMKTGRKTAVAVKDDRAEAEKIALEKGCIVVERPGGNLRCERYCSVNSFCPEYKKEVANDNK